MKVDTYINNHGKRMFELHVTKSHSVLITEGETERLHEDLDKLLWDTPREQLEEENVSLRNKVDDLENEVEQLKDLIDQLRYGRAV